METLRANGVENSMPQLELAVVGSPAKPRAPGGRPGGPRRGRVSPVPSSTEGFPPGTSQPQHSEVAQRHRKVQPPLTGSSGPRAPLLPPADIWRDRQWGQGLPPVCPAVCVCVCARACAEVCPLLCLVCATPLHVCVCVCVCVCLSVRTYLLELSVHVQVRGVVVMPSLCAGASVL